MFRKKSRPTGERTARTSSIVGCLVAFALCMVGILAFLNLGQVVKWAGQPFLVLPELLGLVDQPARDEVILVSALPDSTVEIDLAQAGPYLVYMGVWEGWGGGPSLAISGPDGTFPAAPAYRGVRPYDTPHAMGTLMYRFRVSQTGRHELIFSPYVEEPEQLFTYALVPDYLAGNESTISAAMGLQVVAIVMVLLVFLYFRFLRPNPAKEVAEARDLVRRRAGMDDFLEQKQATKDQP